MRTKKSPLSIRILYWLTNIAFGLIFLITTVVFFLNLFLMTGLFTEEIQLRVQMPVAIEVVEKGSLDLQGDDLTVRIEEAYGKLHFVDTPFYIYKIVARILFLVMLMALFMTWKFRLFMKNLKNGLLFEIQNINNLKHIAYGIVGLWLLTRIYMQLLYSAVVKNIEFATINIGNDVSDFDDVLVVALFLWVLAHVFIKGLEMKEEQELTV